MCYPGSNQEKVNKNCPSVRRGKLKTMNVIREEIRANLCWLSLVIGQRSVVLCFTVTGCETIEATADTGRMLLPLPSNEKKAGKLQRCKLHIVQDHDFNWVVDTIGCFVAHMKFSKTSLASPSWIYQIVMIVIWVSLSLRRADFRRCYIHVEVIVQMGREIWVVAFLVKLESLIKVWWRT